MQERAAKMCQMYDNEKGAQVDQALLVQLESICDVLLGKAQTSISSSSNSASVNTSLDDCWSDDSDDSDLVDWEDLGF